MQITVGGDKLTFDIPVSTPTSELTTSKQHCNSIILTPVNKYLVFNIKNFYLNNPMFNYEYYKIALSLISQDIIDKYNLMDKQRNGFLSDKVEKGKYGTVQAGIIETHSDINLPQSRRDYGARKITE